MEQPYLSSSPRLREQHREEAGKAAELEGAEELGAMPSCGRHMAVALRNSQQLWLPVKTYTRSSQSTLHCEHERGSQDPNSDQGAFQSL